MVGWVGASASPGTTRRLLSRYVSRPLRFALTLRSCRRLHRRGGYRPQGQGPRASAPSGRLRKKPGHCAEKK